MSFFDHLAELRKLFIRSLIVLIAGFGATYVFYEPIVAFLSEPFNSISGQDSKLYVNSVVEAFFVKIKISVLFALLFTFPVHVFHLLKFILPALHPKEKKMVMLFLFLSSLLIAFGVYYSYSLIIPISVQFLTGTGFIPENIGLLLSYERNIMFIFQFLMAGLILFQLPLILNLLLILDVVKLRWLKKYHRYITIVILIGSGIITPPDPASLVMMAAPLLVLFYVTIIVANIFNLGKD